MQVIVQLLRSVNSWRRSNRNRSPKRDPPPALAFLPHASALFRPRRRHRFRNSSRARRLRSARRLHFSPVAFTPPPFPLPSFPPPVAFTSPSRRLHFPSRRLHFPLLSPSFPPPAALTSPSRRLHFSPPMPSIPPPVAFHACRTRFPPVTLASPPVTFTSPPIAFHSLLLNLFPPAHSLPPCSLSFPLLTLFPPAHSLPPCSLSSPLLTRFPPPQSLSPCSLASPLLILFPSAHSPCSNPTFPISHPFSPFTLSYPLCSPLFSRLTPILTLSPPAHSLPPLLTLFLPCSLSFPLLTLFPPFSLSFPLHALFPSLPPVAPLRLVLDPSQSPSLSPPVALVFPVALPSTPRCPRHPSLLPSHLAHFIPPSASLLTPIPFPAPPHPLPCFPLSPSLLPPIAFPAHPCSLCFTLAPSPSFLLTLFPLAHSLYFCSLCSPLLPLFPSVQSVPRCFFSSPLLIPFTVFPPSLTPIPPNAVTGAQHQMWLSTAWFIACSVADKTGKQHYTYTP
ncbi:unnamed protein product [Closterium sp. NIES-65]|nr:unnamed protein product [Closterium sp. NIES-65]